MEDFDTVSPDYTLTCFYLFNNGGRETLIEKLKFANSEFKNRWLDYMQLLSVSKELEVEITSSSREPCLVCDPEAGSCGFNLPRTELYADSRTMELLNLKEGNPYKTSYLLKIMESFVKKQGYLPMKELE